MDLTLGIVDIPPTGGGGALGDSGGLFFCWGGVGGGMLALFFFLFFNVFFWGAKSGVVFSGGSFGGCGRVHVLFLSMGGVHLLLFVVGVILFLGGSILLFVCPCWGHVFLLLGGSKFGPSLEVVWK